MVVSFSKPRLEGKALEHCLAGVRGFGVRMLAGKKWVVVETTTAKTAMKEMRVRAQTLKAELDAAGLCVLAADRAVKLDGKSLSVDVRILVKARKAEGLVEMKWTRQRLSTSIAEARKKLPSLTEASKRGRWMRQNGKAGDAVKASIVGVLAVGPQSWRCELSAVCSDWTGSYHPVQQPTSSRRSGVSGWEKWRGKAAPGHPKKWPRGAYNWDAFNSKRRVKKRPASR